MRFPRMRGEAGRLERELRAARPEPRAEFLLSLAERTESKTRRRASSRLAFGLAVLTFVLGSFASFGGIGYAAAGADSAVKAVKKVVVQKPDKALSSSAAAQYGPAETPTGGTAGESAAGGAAGVQSSLPFTGISLFVTAVLGFALLGAGLILRRAEKASQRE